MLSKEEAIRKHRDMWNWIAERIQERKQLVDVDELKREYIDQHNESVLYNCYLCNYCVDMLETKYWKVRCRYCPLYWESDGDEDGLYQCLDNHEEYGLYGKVRKVRSTMVWEEQYELCKKIANLKEV